MFIFTLPRSKSVSMSFSKLMFKSMSSRIHTERLCCHYELSRDSDTESREIRDSLLNFFEKASPFSHKSPCEKIGKTTPT